MSNDLKTIQEFIIYQEQNARANSSSVTVQNFQELDNYLKKIDDKELQEAILEFCEQQIANNKNSTFSLYISGILSLQENTLNDAHILRLLDIYSDAKKWGIVEFIANKILQFRNNLQALRHLASVYESTEEDSKLINIWEQIVRIDYEEADMMYKLATFKKENGNLEEAIKDYKKAMQRYLHQKNYNQIKDIWNILLENQLLDMDFYFSFINKVERIFSKIKSEDLLQILYNKIKSLDNYDVTITVLKTLLKIDSENEDWREDLINVYRQKYKDNPQLEDFIRMSNLSQSWRNVQEAISDFEKHISFFPGSFVFHNKWGIGRIKEATHQSLTIDFAKKRDHQMDISMAVTSLESLEKSHFWVLKTITSKEKLKKQILEKPMWTLKKILTSLDGADIKIIKSELVPSILTPNEWNTWSVKIRKLLNESPNFRIRSEKSDVYVYSETPMSPIEKFTNIFKQEDSYINKVKLLRKALISKIFENDDVDQDTFLSILDYFSSYVNTISNLDDYNEEFINSLFVCDEIMQYLPAANYHVHVHMKDFIPSMATQTAKQIIKQLKINDYKDNFLTYIKKFRSNDWKELYLQLIPYYHTEDIIKQLENENEIELLQNIFSYIQNNINDFKPGYIWFATNLYDKDWINEVESQFKISCDLLRTAILLYRDIQIKYQVPANKKLFHTIDDFLFESERINKFISTESEKNVAYLYSLIRQLSEFVPNRILKLREVIIQHHPTFDFRDQFDFEQSSSTGFLTLEESYEEKKKILQHIHEVEVPANSKEIEKARSYGDLKENAEYKAALEHQESLNNKVAQLKKEIEQARIFDTKNLNTQNAGFGTKIVLENLDDHSTKTYTILGPWESDPEKGTISYLSPLGQQLYKKKIGEQLDFSINDKSFSVEIAHIEEGI